MADEATVCGVDSTELPAELVGPHAPVRDEYPRRFPGSSVV